MQKILLSIMLLIFSSNVFAVELWQGLESGATSQQVIKRFPNTKVDSNRSFTEGIDNKLIMNDYVVFRRNFTVRFFMEKNKLKKVHLDTEYEKYDQLLWLEAFSALSSKYGAPIQDVHTVYGNSAKWFYNGIEISMLNTLDGISSDSLMITYSTELMDNVGKL